MDDCIEFFSLYYFRRLFPKSIQHFIHKYLKPSRAEFILTRVAVCHYTGQQWQMSQLESSRLWILMQLTFVFRPLTHSLSLLPPYRAVPLCLLHYFGFSRCAFESRRCCILVALQLSELLRPKCRLRMLKPWCARISEHPVSGQAEFSDSEWIFR